MNAADELPDLSLDQLLELQRRADAAAPRDHSDDQTDTDTDDDELVLPWWQHPFNIVALIIAAALMAGMIGWLIGDTGGTPAHNKVDTGFLQDMRVHHEQATDMSRRYMSRPDIDPGLAIVAQSIIQGQTLDIGRMIQLLRDFHEAEAADLTKPSMTWMGMSSPPGRMPGMATDEELAQLNELSGRDADELFATLMINHHEGGVHMAEYAVEQGKSKEVRDFAESMVTSQQSEITEIQRALG